MMLSQSKVWRVGGMLFLLCLCAVSGQAQSWFAPSARMQDALRALADQSSEARPRVILHIGDSHVARGFSSAPVQALLRRYYGASIEVKHKGINGATFATWLGHKDLQALAGAKPLLILLSLGTNDSYTHRFSPEMMRRDVEALVRYLGEFFPSVPIVLTTPPANYLRSSKKSYKRRGRWVYSTSYSFNPNTARASALLRSYAQGQEMGCIDLNAYIGTEDQAQKWLGQGWMHTDRVHYTIPGYTKHGETIGGALVHAIEEATKTK